MLERLADKILNVFNFVPELFLARGDPRFDVYRWWFALVLVLALLIVVGMVRQSFRHRRKR